ncbi:MAG TPA: YppE family protein [Bacillaceae bacterium]
MEEKELKKLTIILCEYCHKAAEAFEKCKLAGQQEDFFSVVKPFADQVKELAEKWEPAAVQWCIENKPKHVHPIQIRNTAENLQMVSVKAFFPDTSKKKFNSHIQSIDFILNNVIKAIEAHIESK